MQDFKKLRVWQLSREFVTDIYNITKNFPSYEQLAMSSQLRRAAYSIPSNIAEGSGKNQKEFSRYLVIVSGSIKELECFLILAKDLNYINEKQFNALNEKLNHIGRMNNKLLKILKENNR